MFIYIVYLQGGPTNYTAVFEYFTITE